VYLLKTFLYAERAVQDIRLDRDRLRRLPHRVHRLREVVYPKSVRRQARLRVRHAIGRGI